MKKTFNYLVLVTLILFVSCSKKDGEAVSDEVPSYNEVEVSSKQFEFTSFTIGGLSASNQVFEYNIEELPDEAIVFNSDETSVSFQTPNIPAGVYHIVLKNFEINITLIVEEVVLNKQPVEIISIFETDLRSSWISIEGNTSEDEELTAMLTSIDRYFDSASEEEKIEAAVYYKANEDLINRLLTFGTDQSGSAKEFSANSTVVGICSDEYIELCNFSKSIIAMGTSVWLTYGLLATPPLELGALITGPAAVVFAKKAKKSWEEFRDKHLLVVAIDFDNSQNNRGTSATKLETTSIVFLSGIEKNINLKINVRPIQESDLNEDLVLLSTVRAGYSTINSLIGKINTAFSWGNNNIPFFDKDLIDLLSYSEDNGTVQKTIGENEFSKFDFVVEHKQVTLEKIDDSNGGILLKLTANKSFVFGKSIETNIFVSYKDEVNEIVEVFPVTLVATAVAETIELVSGEGQEAIVETSLQNPIVVVVKDQNGEVFPGAIVKFTVNEGSVSSGSAITDLNGEATMSWTLGLTEGDQYLTVTAFKEDGTTTLTGSPISVSAIGIVEPSLIGTWSAISLAGVPMGVFTSYYGLSGCPNIVNQQFSDDEFTVKFTETHLTITSKARSKEYEFEEYLGETNPRPCSSYKLKSITDKSYDDISVDPYEIVSSTLLKISGDGETDLVGYQLVNIDKLIINGGDGDIVLIRQ